MTEYLAVTVFITDQLLQLESKRKFTLFYFEVIAWLFKKLYNCMGDDKMKVKVGVSARHVHLSQEDLEILFGEGYELTVKAPLSQPGQYACNEQVIIKGNKGTIERVRILGPVRNKTQVEISKTDTFALGVNAPVRNSGDLEGAGEITIVGPKGEITRNAAIIAARHIHATKEDAKKYGFEGKEFVSIVIDGEKGGILKNVYVRVSDNFSLEVHLDTDDANAFLIKNGDEVELIVEQTNN